MKPHVHRWRNPGARFGDHRRCDCGRWGLLGPVSAAVSVVAYEPGGRKARQLEQRYQRRKEPAHD